MNRRLIFAYQLLIGLSDFSTGALLLAAPEFTLRLMRLRVSADVIPFISFVGAFVLSVGLSCLYGAWLIHSAGSVPRLEAVWLLTAITRGSVAIFIIAAIINGSLESGWLAVAIFDGACTLIQAIGFRRGWLSNVGR